jgi:crotonobetainyl-CoA:carnitine CoA-transferase CaiB-like acyl-CoA transferase
MGPFYNDDPSPDNSLLFGYLNTNKFGVTLDVSTTLGKELVHRLLETADVFLFGGEVDVMGSLGLGYETLRRLNPLLVSVYITPFGLSGPYAGRRGGELVSFHMSALGLMTPGGKEIPKGLSPLKVGGHQALMIAGLTAATATLHALFAREASREGQQVDVSELEPLASFQFMDMARWVYAGVPGIRGTRDVGRAIKCKDGSVALLFGQDHMWHAWVEVMGKPAWAMNPEYRTRAGRTQHQEAVWAGIEAWAAERTKEEIYRAGQSRRVPVFPYNTVAEAVTSAQVQSRDFVKEIPLASGVPVEAPSAPYQFSRTPWRLRRAAPRLGQHNHEIFCGRLGLPPEALVEAYEAGVV